MVSEEFALLALTVVFEFSIALLILRKERWQKIALVVVGINMITHPIVWWLLYYHQTNWFLTEGSVALLEGTILAILFKKRRWPALCAGILMNLVTATIGYVFF